MPDISSVFRSEIVRLCRKELKQESTPLRKITASHRRELAALKKQLAAANKRIHLLERSAAKSAPASPAPTEGKSIRFVAKGLRPLREKLGLSAANFAALINVSEQSVYNWEQKKSIPRRAQVEAIAALRGIGKREAWARLEKLAA